jgi:hypothetical protein
MKKLLLAMTALATVGIAAPVSAQYDRTSQYDRTTQYDYGTQYDRSYQHDRGTQYGDRFDTMTSADFRARITQLEMRLNMGIRQGLISRTEERTVRQRLDYLSRLVSSYSYNGLTFQERRDLQNRLREARNELRFADNGRFDNDRRYSWADNDYYGQGGPLEVDACSDSSSTGIGRIFEGMIGRSCLHIGDRATGSLYAVPWNYRDQYRDTSDSYFRSDGRLIYEFDTDTGRVVNSWQIQR